MSITSAMFTGVSGLLNNGEAINVIGNNIANVNTTAFKTSRTLFADMLYTKVGNSSQIGRGMLMQAVDTAFSQGSLQNTENVTDMAIQGNSFFALKAPTTASPITSQSSALLTRTGTFHVDKDLFLVNPEGYQVLDTQGNPIQFSDNAAAITASATTFAPIVTAAGTDINAVINGGTTSGGTALAGFTAATVGTGAGATGAATAATDALAAANVLPVPGGATQAQKDAAVAAANVSVTAAANLTSSFSELSLAINSLKSAAAAVTAAPNAENAVNAAAANTAVSGTLANFLVASKALSDALNSTASLLNATGNAAAGTAATAATKGATDLTNATALSATTGFSTAQSSVAAVTTANSSVSAEIGKAFGKVIKIDPNGLLSYLGKDGVTTLYYKTSGVAGVPANPANAAIAQRLAVISPTDVQALDKTGGNFYKPTTASGVPTTGFSLAANAPNGSSDKIMSNSLEMSNVDMASQFVSLITTQRAYSANSKTITTADEMTQEVLNLKR